MTGDETTDLEMWLCSAEFRASDCIIVLALTKLDIEIKY